MLRLGPELLKEVGLSELSRPDAIELLQVFRKLLELRVGQRIGDRMTAAQQRAFEADRAAGGQHGQALLQSAVPDYASIVQAEWERLRSEVAASAPTILHVVRDPQAGHDPWRHRRPDPGPVLVPGADGWSVIVSPLGRTCLAVDPPGCELFARFRENPPVILRLPGGHRVEAPWLWCDDLGEVRARFAARSDLRWRLPDRPGADLLECDKVLARRREQLDPPPERSGRPVDFTRGRWRVTAGPGVRLEDPSDGVSFQLEPPCPGAPWDVVDPHFSPDGSQLVAVANAKEPPGGVARACSVGYLDAIKAAPGRGERPDWPWEFGTPDPATPSGRPDGDGIAARFIQGVGYDHSSTRVALTRRDTVEVHHLKSWAALSTIERPDRSSVAVSLPLPGRGEALVAWAGPSVVVAQEDTVARLDPRSPAGALPIPGAAASTPLVCALSTPAGALVVSSDRSLVGIGAAGTVHRHRLTGHGPVIAAGALHDGRLLVSTGNSLQLVAGASLLAEIPVDGPPVAGVAPSTGWSDWALVWHADDSVSTVRIRRGELHLSRRSVPRPPTGGLEPRARGAVMIGPDSWFLLAPAGGPLNDGRPYVATTNSWIDMDASLLAAAPDADLLAAATTRGIEFVAAGQLTSGPHPVPLPGPIRDIAAGADGRSLAVTTAHALWLVRLLI